MKSESGKAFRSGLSLIDIMEMFPNEAAAVEWLEWVMWSSGRCCR